MKKKKDISGLIFSAFLVIAYVICSYFFIGIISGSTGLESNVKLLMKCGVFVIFGAILFYATRVGDGKQIKRFSLSALLLIDIPALYIILAASFPMLPFPFDLSNSAEMVSIAATALGYGIPYTFLSGFELDIPKKETSDANTTETDDTETGTDEDKDEKESEEDTSEEKITESEDNNNKETEE